MSEEGVKSEVDASGGSDSHAVAPAPARPSQADAAVSSDDAVLWGDGALASIGDAVRALAATWAPAGEVGAGHPVSTADALDDDRLVEVLEAVAHVEHSLTLLKMQCSSAIARRSVGESRHEGIAGRHGYSTPERFIAATTGSSTAEAAKLIAVANATTPAESFGAVARAPRYPQLAEALADGTIAVEAANRIIEFLDSVRLVAGPEALRRAEAQLIERVSSVGIDQLARYIKYLRAELDTAQVQAREEGLWAERSLRIWEDRRGLIHLRACLDPATAAPIKAAVDALVSADLHAARGAKSRLAARDAAARRAAGSAGGAGGAVDTGGDDDGSMCGFDSAGVAGVADVARAGVGGVVANGAEASSADTADATAPELDAADADAPDSADRALIDARSIEQMAADALADLVRLATSATAAPPALASARVVVRIDHDSLTRDVGFATIDGIDQPVSPATVRGIAASAGVIPMVLGGPSEVLDLGRGKRFFTKAQRVALAERDGGCAHPDCARPIAHTQAHHIRWWEADDGPSDLDNGVLLCAFHHWCMHHDGWQVFLRDGGIWFVPPPHLDAAQRPRPGRRSTRLELHAASAAA